jgi:hypothetical protein
MPTPLGTPADCRQSGQDVGKGLRRHYPDWPANTQRPAIERDSLGSQRWRDGAGLEAQHGANATAFNLSSLRARPLGCTATAISHCCKMRKVAHLPGMLVGDLQLPRVQVGELGLHVGEAAGADLHVVPLAPDADTRVGSGRLGGDVSVRIPVVLLVRELGTWACRRTSSQALHVGETPARQSQSRDSWTCHLLWLDEQAPPEHTAALRSSAQAAAHAMGANSALSGFSRLDSALSATAIAQHPCCPPATDGPRDEIASAIRFRYP